VTLVNKVDGTYTTDFTEELSINDEGKVIVDCLDGVCFQTQGYIRNNGITYVFNREESGVEVNEGLIGGSSCNSESVGKLLTGESAACITSGSSIAFEDDDDDYIIMNGSAVEGTPFENADEIKAVKRSVNYIIIDKHFTTSMYN